MSRWPAPPAHRRESSYLCGQSIIVDLEGLEYIDSLGLGILLCVLQWARRRGGDLSLAAPQRQVREVLEGCGMTGVFSVSRSVREAASGASLPFGAGAKERFSSSLDAHFGPDSGSCGETLP